MLLFPFGNHTFPLSKQPKVFAPTCVAGGNCSAAVKPSLNQLHWVNKRMNIKEKQT